MLEFEVGDRVCTIDKGRGYSDTGKTGEVVRIEPHFEWPEGIIGSIEVELDDGARNSFPVDQVELISKGEDSMQDIDAIAVEVDDEELANAFLEKFDKSGFVFYGSLTKGDYHGVASTDGKKFVISEEGELHFTRIDGSHSSIDIDSIDKTYQLPQDWNKVVEFLKQQSQPTPELNGYEAEIDTKGLTTREISVGCWSGEFGDLVNFRQICQEIGIGSGTITVQGETIDLHDLYNFIEDVKEVVKD